MKMDVKIPKIPIPRGPSRIAMNLTRTRLMIILINMEPPSTVVDLSIFPKEEEVVGLSVNFSRIGSYPLLYLYFGLNVTDIYQYAYQKNEKK